MQFSLVAGQQLSAAAMAGLLEAAERQLPKVPEAGTVVQLLQVLLLLDQADRPLVAAAAAEVEARAEKLVGNQATVAVELCRRLGQPVGPALGKAAEAAAAAAAAAGV